MTINFADLAKTKQLRDFFQQHGRIYIVIDATHDDVKVPDFLKDDPALRLVLNNRMPQAIYIKDGEVSSVFSFSGQSHRCTIPVSRIWAAYQPDNESAQSLTWEDAVPGNIRDLVDAARSIPEDDGEDQNPQSIASTDSTAEKSTDSSARKKSHLRVVK
ncbi:MAG: ClpXP protease specificity-enhancing factor SspB [Mariprofundaceae bacterium]